MFELLNIISDAFALKLSLGRGRCFLTYKTSILTLRSQSWGYVFHICLLCTIFDFTKLIPSPACFEKLFLPDHEHIKGIINTLSS